MTYSYKQGISILFVLAFIVLLFTDPILFQFFSDDPLSTDGFRVGERFTLIAFPISLLLFFKRNENVALKLGLAVSLAYFIYLVFVSLYYYNTPFIYPHVFSKFTPVFVIYFFYLFFKDVSPKLIEKAFLIIFLVIIANILILKRQFLNVGSFVSLDRPIIASSAYLLIIPFLLFLNKYAKTKNYIYLLGFYFSAGLLFFVQQRTVWGCVILVILANAVFINKIRDVRFDPRVLFYLFIMPLIGVILLSTIILAAKPKFYTRMVENIEDIVNYKEQGTGSWRYEQYQSYKPFVQDNFFFGMGFDGFELPIQFYNVDTGIQVFRDGTGHHIHNFYIHTMFYHGIVGLLILIFPLIYYLILCFKKRKMGIVNFVFFAFICSGILYGLNYSLPFFYFALLGLGLASLERKEKSIENERTLMQSLQEP